MRDSGSLACNKKLKVRHYCYLPAKFDLGAENSTRHGNGAFCGERCKRYIHQSLYSFTKYSISHCFVSTTADVCKPFHGLSMLLSMLLPCYCMCNVDCRPSRKPRATFRTYFAHPTQELACTPIRDSRGNGLKERYIHPPTYTILEDCEQRGGHSPTYCY